MLPHRSSSSASGADGMVVPGALLEEASRPWGPVPKISQYMPPQLCLIPLRSYSFMNPTYCAENLTGCSHLSLDSAIHNVWFSICSGVLNSISSFSLNQHSTHHPCVWVTSCGSPDYLQITNIQIIFVSSSSIQVFNPPLHICKQTSKPICSFLVILMN